MEQHGGHSGEAVIVVTNPECSPDPDITFLDIFVNIVDLKRTSPCLPHSFVFSLLVKIT